MSLKDEIAAWDLKSKDAICAVYDRHAGVPGFAGEIIAFFDDPALQAGATWLLKHHFDEGGDGIGEPLSLAVFERLPVLEGWPARLHVLQCLDRMPIPASMMRQTERFLCDCLKDDVKFVRAWAYNGLHRLAEQYPQFQVEATQTLENALVTETAGSVLARVRRALKTGF